MAQTSEPAQLLHFSPALMHGIHIVFPLSQVSGNNWQHPICKKKLESGKGQWEVRKEVIGWMVDGATRCIELARENQSEIDVRLYNIVIMLKRVRFKRIKN